MKQLEDVSEEAKATSDLAAPFDETLQHNAIDASLKAHGCNATATNPGISDTPEKQAALSNEELDNVAGGKDRPKKSNYVDYKCTYCFNYYHKWVGEAPRCTKCGHTDNQKKLTFLQRLKEPTR